MLKLQISQIDFKYVRDGIHINQIKSSQPGHFLFLAPQIVTVYGAARLNLIQWVFPSFLTSNSDSKLTWILAAGSTSEVSEIADMKSPRAICFQGMTCRHQAIAQIASLAQMRALMCCATAVRSTSSSRSPPASMGRGRIGHAPRHRTGFLPHHQSPLNYGQTNPVGTRKMWGSLVEVLGQVACLLTYEPQQIG